jgi:hypothetical protein
MDVQAKRRTSMSRYATIQIAAAVFVALAAAAFISTPARAASDAEKQATATCKAEVKEQARYQEMSWWARHKAVKKCVNEALAHH